LIKWRVYAKIRKQFANESDIVGVYLCNHFVFKLNQLCAAVYLLLERKIVNIFFWGCDTTGFFSYFIIFITFYGFHHFVAFYLTGFKKEQHFSLQFDEMINFEFL
jgi:hypothetical protein